MKTNIEFATERFPAVAEETAQVNRGRHGKRLAEYIAQNLSRHGFSVAGVVAEDWGWKIQIENKDFPVWIGCGNYEEFENGFLCFLEPAKPSVRKFFKKIDTLPTMARLADALEKVIRQPETSATRIRWWSASER